MEVTLEGVGSQRLVKLAARVAWSAPADGGHQAGFAFKGRLDYYDLTCLAYDRSRMTAATNARTLSASPFAFAEFS